MVLEMAVVKDMRVRVRPHVLVNKQHGFWGGDRPGFPFLPPSMNYRMNAIHLLQLLYSHPLPCSIFAYGCSTYCIELRPPGSFALMRVGYYWARATVLVAANQKKTWTPERTA